MVQWAAHGLAADGASGLRPHDYFLDEDDEALDFDLLDELRVKPVAQYTDMEAALAFAELMAQEFVLYGTSGDTHIGRNVSGHRAQYLHLAKGMLRALP